MQNSHGGSMLSDDEIYLACLLAIGPWDWKVEQTEFLMDQLNRKLGRRASLDEGLAFINGYRTYSLPKRPSHDVKFSNAIANVLVKPQLEKMIDTHNVGK
jgi:hypothetical protein